MNSKRRCRSRRRMTDRSRIMPRQTKRSVFFSLRYLAWRLKQGFCGGQGNPRKWPPPPTAECLYSRRDTSRFPLRIPVRRASDRRARGVRECSLAVGSASRHRLRTMSLRDNSKDSFPVARYAGVSAWRNGVRRVIGGSVVASRTRHAA